MASRDYEASIQQALTALDEGQFKYRSNAVEFFSVAETTLRAREKGRLPRLEAHSEQFLLTDIQEGILSDWIINLEASGFTLTLSAVSEMVA